MRSLAVVLFLSSCGGGEQAGEPLAEAGGALTLKSPLDLDERSSPDEVRRQLAQHAMARGVLTARFGRR